MPAANLPRKGLVSGDGAILQLTDEAVNTDFTVAGMVGVLVVSVLVDTEQAIVRTDIALEPGVIRTRGVNHDAFDGVFAVRLVTGVFGQKKLMQIHYLSSFSERSWSCSRTALSFAGIGKPRCPAFSIREMPSLER